MSKPIIKPINKPGDSYNTSVNNMSLEEMTAAIGFPPNVENDDPGKVRWSWGFTVDGVRCGVWDYYRSADYGSWSAYGPREALIKVFGSNKLGSR